VTALSLDAVDQLLLDSAVSSVCAYVDDVLAALHEGRQAEAEQLAALLKDELAAGVSDRERPEVIARLQRHIALSANGQTATIDALLGLPAELHYQPADILESLVADCVKKAAAITDAGERDALLESALTSLAQMRALAINRWRDIICAAFNLTKRTFDSALEEHRRSPGTPPPNNASTALADGARPPSQSTVLVELAEKNLTDCFHDNTGTAYGCANIKGHRETMRMRTMAFREWLGQLFFKDQKKAPGGQALQDAINVLEGKAKFDGPERIVYLRVGELDDKIYLDLGDPQWRAIEISPAGWPLVISTPVYFWRARGMGALPVPEQGGSIDELRTLISVEDDDFFLIVGWLLAAYRAHGPYPVLSLMGEAGTAKTTKSRSLKGLVDPGEDGARAEPREVRDLMIAAKNHWVLSYDNLSYPPDWLSDALCRLSTGGGFGTRELYSNDEEIFLSAQRPLILNGIEDVITRGDLLDRAIPITLPVIDDTARQEERVYWAAFDAARPRILGALLDAVCVAQRTVDQVQLDRLPRMADFARWVTAAEPALGWPRGAFLRTYVARQRDSNEIVLTAARISTPLQKVVAGAGGRFEGAYSDLLQDLLTIQPKLAEDKKRPLNERRLAGELRRIAPNLRKLGIDVQIARADKRQPRHVIITQRKTDEAIPNIDDGLVASERPHQEPLIQAGFTIKAPVEANEADQTHISSVSGYANIGRVGDKDSAGTVLEEAGNRTASAAFTASVDALGMWHEGDAPEPPPWELDE
jgi:hypothetical protein